MPLDDLFGTFKAVFPCKPPFDLRERLKRLGFRFSAEDNAWLGSVQIKQAKALYPVVKKAGGELVLVSKATEDGCGQRA